MKPALIILVLGIAVYGWLNKPHKTPSLFMETQFIGYVEGEKNIKVQYVPHTIQKVEDTVYLRSLVSQDSVKFILDSSRWDQKYPVLYTSGMYIVWGDKFVAFYNSTNLDNCRIFSQSQNLFDYGKKK